MRMEVNMTEVTIGAGAARAQSGPGPMDRQGPASSRCARPGAAHPVDVALLRAGWRCWESTLCAPHGGRGNCKMRQPHDEAAPPPRTVRTRHRIS